MSDKKRAKTTPSEAFESPLDVVADKNLSYDDKVEILKQWHYDCVQLETAQGENMQGGERSKLREVLKALNQLLGDPKGLTGAGHEK